MINVFHAVGDPTRRELLERLRRGGAQSLSELASGFPMSRQAVTKHLDLLEEAELVSRRTEGRQRIHELRGEPLKELSDWLAPFEAEWDRRLARLRTHLEEGGRQTDREGGRDG
jgi:DNA-binding transcriptional ArsR family regulator